MSASSQLPHPPDIPAFSHEWAVLLECASPRLDEAKLADLVQSVDWQRLLLLAEEHSVVGHLAASLRRLEKLVAPSEFQKALTERQRALVLHSLRITAELCRLLERFAAEGIGALVVKGPVLSVQAYGDPAMRSYGDVDLLVRQGDIRRATELMIAAGYEAKVPVAAIDAGRIPGQYLFHSPDSKLIIELHNDYTLRYFPRRLPIEEFFARQIRVPLDAHRAPALCVEDELILICVHGAKHFWERLIWIADVAALVTRQSSIDWQLVAASARELQAEHIVNTGLRLAGNLLKALLPEQIQKKVNADRVVGGFVRQITNWLPAAGHAPPGLVERAFFRMRMRGGLISGLAYLLRLSFSPTEEDWDAPSTSRRAGFLEAMRRPFRLARKHGGSRDL
jgi:hypothetical protein